MGRHCCLWCDVTYTDLQKPKAARGTSQKRTLESLKEAHDEFVAAGSNIKNAKFFKNVIDEAFFDIPVNHVCLQ